MVAASGGDECGVGRLRCVATDVGGGVAQADDEHALAVELAGAPVGHGVPDLAVEVARCTGIRGCQLVPDAQTTP